MRTVPTTTPDTTGPAMVLAGAGQVRRIRTQGTVVKGGRFRYIQYVEQPQEH